MRLKSPSFQHRRKHSFFRLRGGCLSTIYYYNFINLYYRCFVFEEEIDARGVIGVHHGYRHCSVKVIQTDTNVLYIHSSHKHIYSLGPHLSVSQCHTKLLSSYNYPWQCTSISVTWGQEAINNIKFQVQTFIASVDLLCLKVFLFTTLPLIIRTSQSSKSVTIRESFFSVASPEQRVAYIFLTVRRLFP